MKLYVNSGNTVVHQGKRYHSGTLLPEELIGEWNSDDKERLLAQGVVCDKPPTLDPAVDMKVGSAAVKESQKAPEKEDFASKQLSKQTVDSGKKKGKK